MFCKSDTIKYIQYLRRWELWTQKGTDRKFSFLPPVPVIFYNFPVLIVICPDHDICMPEY